MAAVRRCDEAPRFDPIECLLLPLCVRCGRPHAGLNRCWKDHNPRSSGSGQFSFGTAQRKFVEAFASDIVSDVVVENSSHFVAEEQPERLTAELRNFFDD